MRGHGKLSHLVGRLAGSRCRNRPERRSSDSIYSATIEQRDKALAALEAIQHHDTRGRTR